VWVNDVDVGGSCAVAVENDGSRDFPNVALGCEPACAKSKRGDWSLVGLFHRSAVAQVACGMFHTMFLLQSSEIYAIGRGDWGLLGMGDRMDRKLPCKVTELQVFSSTLNPPTLNSLTMNCRISELHLSRAVCATGCGRPCFSTFR
jgi:hypothetical protein